jgi:hypothetical protein
MRNGARAAKTLKLSLEADEPNIPQVLANQLQEVEPMAGIGQPAASHTALRTKALALEFTFSSRRFTQLNQA